jgi:UMF1 family MFS transporter
VVLMPLVGAVADRTGRKRDLMLGCGVVGALACVAMVFVGRTDWQLGAALFAVAFLGYSCSIVVSYSLLVDLSSAADRDATSSRGWALAYLGGAIPLTVDFALSPFLDQPVLARLALCTAGVWWLAWSVPVRRRLPARIGTGGGASTGTGLGQLARTIRHARGYPITLAFLAAFLVYNDGIQTVVTVSAQYGDKELRLSDSVLLSGILLVQFVAFGGALWLGRLAARFGAQRIVLASLIVWLAVVGAAYLLQAGVAWQFYLVALVIALVLGGTQALSRAMFSRLIPAGSEAQYFGFYEISDAGTAWLGPLLFGLAYQNSGSYRTALVSLVVFFVVGFALLVRVPVRRGIEQAGNEAPALI